MAAVIRGIKVALLKMCSAGSGYWSGFVTQTWKPGRVHINTRRSQFSLPHSSSFVVCWFLMRRHYKVLMGRISIIIVFPAHSIIYTPMNKIITSPVFLLKLVYLILPFMQQLFRTSQNCENEPV